MVVVAGKTVNNAFWSVTSALYLVLFIVTFGQGVVCAV